MVHTLMKCHISEHFLTIVPVKQSTVYKELTTKKFNVSKSRPQGYQTWVHSQTQNKVQWLAACGHVSARSQSLRFILSLRM